MPKTIIGLPETVGQLADRILQLDRFEVQTCNEPDCFHSKPRSRPNPAVHFHIHAVATDPRTGICGFTTVCTAWDANTANLIVCALRWFRQEARHLEEPA